MTGYKVEILRELDAKGGAAEVEARDPRSAQDAESFTAAADVLRDRELIDGARTLENYQFGGGYYDKLRARITADGPRLLAARRGRS